MAAKTDKHHLLRPLVPLLGEWTKHPPLFFGHCLKTMTLKKNWTHEIELRVDNDGMNANEKRLTSYTFLPSSHHINIVQSSHHAGRGNRRQILPVCSTLVWIHYKEGFQNKLQAYYPELRKKKHIILLTKASYFQVILIGKNIKKQWHWFQAGDTSMAFLDVFRI